MTLSRKWLPAVVLGVVATLVFADALLGRGVFFHRDIQSIWYPQTASMVRAVGEGAWPLWDPYPTFGVPALANPSYQVAYPPYWLNLILAPALFYKLFVLSHALAAGMGLHALGRRWGLGRLAALVAGATWMTSGPFLSFPSLSHHYAGLAWMPWVLVTLDVALQRRTPTSVLALGTLAACQVLAGSGDVCLMTALLSLVQTGFRLHMDGNIGLSGVRNAARVACPALAWAALLSAVQWLPTAGILRSGTRLAFGPGTNMYWSLHPARLADLLVPRLVTDLPMSDAVRAVLFESRGPFVESPYIGVGVVVLALLGFVIGRRTQTWIAGGATLFFLACALGRHTPLYPLLLKIPPFFMMRYPVKYLAAASLCWSLAAGLGVDAWMRGWSSLDRRRAGLVALGTLICALLTGGIAQWVLTHPEAVARVLAEGMDSTEAVPKLWVATLWVVTLAVVIALRAARAVAPVWLTAGLVLVVQGDLLDAARGVNGLAPRELETHQPGWIHQIDRTSLRRLYALPASVEVRSQVVRWPEGWTPEWIGTLGLIDAMTPPIGARWAIEGSYDGDFTGLAPQPFSNITNILNRLWGTPGALRLLQIGGVDHVVALQEVTGLGPEVLRYASVFSAPVRLYAVPDPLPRVYLVDGVRIATGNAAYSALLAPGFDPRREVLLERGQPRTWQEGFTGSSRILWRRADALAVDVEASRSGHLVLLESYDPGWHAWVDGVSAGVQRANLLFRAVEVPAGRHVVEYRYRPWTALAGGFLSVAGLLSALVVIALSKRGHGLIDSMHEGSIEAP